MWWLAKMLCCVQFRACFWVAWFIFICIYLLFYLGQLIHFPSCSGAGVTNLNEPPSSFLLPPHYCGLGAGSIPLRAIVNNKQCETRGLFVSLVIHYWIGDVQDSQDVSASEMTYTVSGGALNSTHSLEVTGGIWQFFSAPQPLTRPSRDWRSEHDLNWLYTQNIESWTVR